MAIEDNSTYKFVMEHQKFISIVEGILIIILITGLWIMYFHEMEIKKEISKNCGWGGEDYECYCQKDTALAMKDAMFGKEININLSDVAP